MPRFPAFLFQWLDTMATTSCGWLMRLAGDLPGVKVRGSHPGFA